MTKLLLSNSLVYSSKFLIFSHSRKNFKSPKSFSTLCGFIVDDLQVSLQFSLSNEDVLSWISNLGFPQYQNTFKVNLINGKNLILLDASALVKMNIKDFSHIKVITKSIREMYKIELDKFSRSISLPTRHPETFFKFYKVPTGPIYELCSRTEFFRKLYLMGEAEIELNHFEKLHQWLKHIPELQNTRIGNIKRINLYFVEPNTCRELELVENVPSCTCKIPRCDCKLRKEQKLRKSNFLIRVEESKSSENYCSKSSSDDVFDFIVSSE